MKFRYLFSAIAASLVLLSGCAKEESVGSLDNIELSDTFLSIKAEGGSVGLTITATEDWAFQTIDKTWPEVVSEKDGQEVRTPSWLSVDKMSGTSGQTKVTFSAEATETGRELSLSIKVGTNMQFLKVRQGSLDPVALTCKDIEDGKVTVGANYKMAGTVVQLGNYASYGAFYINDGTSTKNAQIYSSTDESKAAFPNVEVGDYVEFSGSWSSYGNFEGAEISKLKKALVKVKAESKNVSVDKKGGDVEILVEYKGNGVFVGPLEHDWVTFKEITYEAGKPDKLTPNPANIAHVKFAVAANVGDVRDCQITFRSYATGENETYTDVCTISQKSALSNSINETFATGAGDFEINDVKLPEGSKYVWSYDDRNGGYMKASAFVSNVAYEAESWLISPIVDLTAVETASLSFEHALNFLKTDKREDHVTLQIRKKDGEWAELKVPTWPEGKNWTFVSSGNIDLKDYVGNKIQIAFKYVGGATIAPTYEVRNVVLK